MDPLFYEVFNDLPRQGPGQLESTRRAFHHLKPQRPIRTVLDIGSGSGIHSLELCKLTPASILSIDTNPVTVDILNRKFRQAGYSSRAEARIGDMLNLEFPESHFDLIWAESCIFIIGFEKGLREWKRVLAPDGWLVLSEAVWLTPERPAEIQAWWDHIYPDIRTIEQNQKIIRDCGYYPADSFVMDPSAWWDDFYIPMEKKIGEMRIKYQNDETARPVLDALTEEIDMYRRYSDYYGYAFFIMHR